MMKTPKSPKGLPPEMMPEEFIQSSPDHPPPNPLKIIDTNDESIVKTFLQTNLQNIEFEARIG